MRVSYLEIYNEEIRDLLSLTGVRLKIHEDLEHGVFVKDAKEEVVISLEQCLALMGAGEARRHIGRTDMNDASSRSHTIFRMVYCAFLYPFPHSDLL